MPERSIQLVLQYDGAEFSGWQRQASARTVQGELEAALERLTRSHIRVRGSGRTDAGVHALGQSAGVVVPDKWTSEELQRALNAVLPDDVKVTAAWEMKPGFDARRQATRRRYSYWLTTANCELRTAQTAWCIEAPLNVDVLHACADAIVGDHSFRSFAVRGTAPEHDEHRAVVYEAAWVRRPGGLVFFIEANRFLHHMVRFLVGTMVEFASGRRADSWQDVMTAEDNAHAAPPAPAHALFLERVTYPSELYLTV